VGASLPTRIKEYFNAMEISQCTFKEKFSGYEYAVSWENYVYRIVGFSGRTLSLFSEAW
jgi:hypothetical protein